MSRVIGLGQNNLRLWYYRYKDTPYFSLGVIVIVFAICIILFFRVIIPQIHDWFSIRDEVARTRVRINNIEKNINFVNTLDKPLLDSQLDIATSALPIEKNFGPIVNALSAAAFASGVTLNDFSFQVGNVASTAGKLNIYGQKDLSVLTINITIGGSAENIGLFLKEIQDKLPLSEVTRVDGDSFSTGIAIQFYQKQLPKIVFKDDQLIAPISAQNLSLLDKLSNWQPALAQEEAIGTESAESIPLF